MKISVDRKYVEAWRKISWKDVKDAFFFFLKNPGLIALLVFLGLVIIVGKIDPVADDVLRSERRGVN